MVKFERSILGLQRFLNYHSPQEFIEAIESGQKFPPLDFSFNNREQKGWLISPISMKISASAAAAKARLYSR